MPGNAAYASKGVISRYADDAPKSASNSIARANDSGSAVLTIGIDYVRDPVAFQIQSISARSSRGGAVGFTSGRSELGGQCLVSTKCGNATGAVSPARPARCRRRPG